MKGLRPKNRPAVRNHHRPSADEIAAPVQGGTIDTLGNVARSLPVEHLLLGTVGSVTYRKTMFRSPLDLGDSKSIPGGS